MKYDLSALQGNISNATLKFTIASDPGSGTVSVYKGNGTNWTEENLSTSNRPSRGALLGTINKTYSTGSTHTVSLNATDLGSSFLSLVVVHSNGNDTDFASKEHTTYGPPQLILNGGGTGSTEKLPCSGNLENVCTDLDFERIYNNGVQSIFDMQDAQAFIQYVMRKKWAQRQFPILRDAINGQLNTDYGSYNEAQNAYIENYVRNIRNVENATRVIGDKFSSKAWKQDKNQIQYTEELFDLRLWDKLSVWCGPHQAPDCERLSKTIIRGVRLGDLTGSGFGSTRSPELDNLMKLVEKDFSDSEYGAGLNRAYARGMNNLADDESLVSTFTRWHNLHINKQDIVEKVFLMSRYLYYTGVGRFNESLLSTVDINPFEKFDSYERLESMGKPRGSVTKKEGVFGDAYVSGLLSDCAKGNLPIGPRGERPDPRDCNEFKQDLLDLREQVIQEHIENLEQEDDDEPVCVEVCGANEKLDEDKCECIPTNCEYKKGYLHESAFTDKTAALGENTTSSQDNLRDESGVIVADVNCDSGKIDSGSTIVVTGPKESRDYIKSDGTTAQSNYFPVEYLDCPKGNRPGNPDYDSAKPCSDCTSGDPIPNPEIQAQLTACGVKGGMYGYTRGIASGCTSQKHGGIDIANAEGEAVYAMFDGTASLEEQGNGASGAGFYVTVTSTVDGDTIKSYYFHLEDDTRVSGSVRAGDIIGYQGDSGNLKGAIEDGYAVSHLHVKVKKNGVVVDPEDYMKTSFNDTTGVATHSSDCN